MSDNQEAIAEILGLAPVVPVLIIEDARILPALPEPLSVRLGNADHCQAKGFN
jgi:hypothetical protein